LQILFCTTSFALNSVNTQPNVSITVSPLSGALYKQSIEAQDDIYKNQQPLNSLNNADSISIEYALARAAKGDKDAEIWAIHVLNVKADMLINAIYSNQILKNNSLTTFSLAQDMYLFAMADAFWVDPKYEEAIKLILNYLNLYVSNGSLYYVSSVNKQINPETNSYMAIALTIAYASIGDKSYLKEATRIINLIQSTYGLMDGGYVRDINNKSQLFLQDNIVTGLAYLILYRSTADQKYLALSIKSADFINQNFVNSMGDNFLNSINVNDKNNKINSQSVVPNGNMLMLRYMELLYYYTNNIAYDRLFRIALQHLMAPEVIATHPPAFTLMAYFRATEAPLHITIVGPKQDPIASSLFHIALEYPYVYTQIDWWDRSVKQLFYSNVRFPLLKQVAAYVCVNAKCSLPIFSPQDLDFYIHMLIRNDRPISLESTSYSDHLSQGLSVSNSSSKINLLNEPTPLIHFLEKANFIYILSGFWIMGILLAFTPCFLPLSLMMLGLIGSGYMNASKNKHIALTFTYVFSLAIAYAMAGFIAVKMGVYIQAYMQATWVVIAFAILFFLLAAIALELFKVKLPDKLRHHLVKYNSIRASGSFVGVFVMGLLATLIAAPCMVAPLAAILAYVAQTKAILFGTLVLFITGLGVGTPLLLAVLLGMKLPQAGLWQKRINYLFGLVLLGIAIWILSHVILSVWFNILWAFLFIFAAIIMGLLNPLSDDIYEKLWKALSILILIFGIMFLQTIFVGNKDNFSASIGQPTNQFSELSNLNHLQNTFETAKAQHQPVMLFFYSDWCVSCKKIEENVFSEGTIKTLLTHFMVKAVNISNPNSSEVGIAKRYGIFAPPAILFFDEEGKQINQYALTNVSVSELTTILNNILKNENK